MSNEAVAPADDVDISRVDHKGVEVTDESYETSSGGQTAKNVVNEKTGEISIESPQDEDTEYVKGHPVIRTGNYCLLFNSSPSLTVHRRPRRVEIHSIGARRWRSCFDLSFHRPGLGLYCTFKCDHDAVPIQTVPGPSFCHFFAA
jgi:hypothetical protein